MKYPIVLIMVLVIGGCATLPLPESAFDLSSMEQLQIGKTTAPELRARFGEPQQIYPLSKSEDAWFYGVEENDRVVQKASFVLSRESGILLTATWIPTGQDPLSSKASALAYFKKASFQLKKAGQTTHHGLSNDAVYFDPQLALSIRVNPTTDSVVAVAFGGSPSPSSLAVQK